MTTALLLISILAGATPAGTGHGVPPGPLTLAQAVAMAERFHPLLAAAAARREGLAHHRLEVAAAARARVELQAERVGGLSGAKGAGLGVQGIAGSQLVSDNAVGLNIFQRIYDHGEVHSKALSVQRITEASQEEEEALRREVGLDTVRAFAQVKKEEALVDLDERFVNDRMLFVAQVETFHRAGLRPAVDVSLARIQLTRARSLRVRAKNQLERAWQALSKALGFPPDLPGTLAPAPFQPGPAPAPDELRARAVVCRPEVLAAKRVLEAAREEARAVRASRKPLVVGFASSGLADTSRPGSDLEWAGGLALKLPVDISAQIRERVAQADLRVTETQARLRDQEDRVRLDVVEARIDYENLREQLGVDLEEAGEARTALNVSDAQYRAGMGTFLDRLQAENELADAAARIVERQSDLLTAWVRLQVACGLPVEAALARSR